MLVQYIILNGDLLTRWTQGAVVAQACHACAACLAIFARDPNTIAYLAPSNLCTMTKVVLKTRDSEELRELQASLTRDGLDHHAWIEQPENLLTCIATKPYEKSAIGHAVAHLKLLR